MHRMQLTMTNSWQRLMNANPLFKTSKLEQKKLRIHQETVLNSGLKTQTSKQN